jgi:hypothetical protein
MCNIRKNVEDWHSKLERNGWKFCLAHQKGCRTLFPLAENIYFKAST